MTEPTKPANNGFKPYGNILQTLTVVSIALSGLYAGIITPINQKIRENTDQIARNAAESVRRDERVTSYAIDRFDKFLSKEQHREFENHFQKEIQDLQRQITELRAERSRR